MANKDIFKCIRKYVEINTRGTGSLMISIKPPLLQRQAVEVKTRQLAITFDAVEYSKLLSEIEKANEFIAQYENEQRDEAQKAVDAGYAQWLDAGRTAYIFKSHARIPYSQCPKALMDELKYCSEHPEKTPTCEVKREIFAADKKDLSEDEKLTAEEAKKLDAVIHMRKTDKTREDLPHQDRFLLDSPDEK